MPNNVHNGFCTILQPKDKESKGIEGIETPRLATPSKP